MGKNGSLGKDLRKPKWENYTLSEIKKNFYEPSNALLARSQNEIEEYK